MPLIRYLLVLLIVTLCYAHNPTHIIKVTTSCADIEYTHKVVVTRVFNIFTGCSIVATKMALQTIKRDPRVVSIYPITTAYSRQALNSQSITVFGGETIPTGVSRIYAAYNNSGTTKVPATPYSVRVATLDTGIDIQHQDLNIGGGYNCVANNNNYNDDNGHGTHVAGIIGATNDGEGLVGVAPSVPIYAIKVLDKNGVGTLDTVICGLEWLLLNTSATVATLAFDFGIGSGTDDGCCGCETNDLLHLLLCYVSVVGNITFVAAAGDNGINFATTIPAAYQEVLTVTAISDLDGTPGGYGSSNCTSDTDDTYASYSNYNTLSTSRQHTISAPGTCINSTYPINSYSVRSGTSMACAHAAGVVVLCLSGYWCDPISYSGDVIAKVVNRAYQYSAIAAIPTYQPFIAPSIGTQYYGYLLAPLYGA